jgi:thiopeptide-type bacteriocin biosynthesis protein
MELERRVSESRWHSWHLYRAEIDDAFIRSAVRPFVTSIDAEALADSFFFVRYWDRGAHLRLRVKSRFGEAVDERVRRHFKAFFTSHPSRREHDGPDLLPNDSVQVAEYEPELDRYGGIERMPIVESQFEASSRAVLDLLADGSSYEGAIGAAIRLHLIFARALGLNCEQTVAFFREIARCFLRHPSIGVQDDAGEAHFLAIFDKAFERSREPLIAAQSSLWSALDEGIEFEERWANRWLADMRDVACRLRAISGSIGLRELEICHSCFHMTNNRLGIRNHDEPFVARIIERSMRSILEPAH